MSERPGDTELYEESIGEKPPVPEEGDLEAYKRLRDTYDWTLSEGESLD